MKDGESGRKRDWRKTYSAQRLGNKGNQDGSTEGIS